MFLCRRYFESLSILYAVGIRGHIRFGRKGLIRPKADICTSDPSGLGALAEPTPGPVTRRLVSWI